MDFGITFGPRGATGTPEGLAARAQQADRLGFAYVGIPDHVVFPRETNSRYPYSANGAHPSKTSGTCLEQMTVLAYIAALTRNVRLLSSVLVVPHRPAILAAKMLASIDVLSHGRLTVGVGVGWLAEEINALGAMPFATRGAGTDAFIAIYRQLWGSDAPRGDTAGARLDGLVFEPKPVQRPGPPIWVGGEGAAARRRAGRLGDGWYPTIRNPREPLDRPELFAAALAEVHAHARAAGRDPSGIDVAVYANSLGFKAERTDKDGRRVAFTGSAEAIADDARAFAKVGARHILVGFESTDLAQSLDQVEQFARDVMPLARQA